MTRVEFYVLPSAHPEGRLRAACQLAAKGWRHGLPVFLRCADDSQCGELDELLWRFKPESFIPHGLYASDPQGPVVIGRDEPPAWEPGLLVNLDTRLSPHLDRFGRVIEIVNQAPDLLTACRENFRLYRQRGYDPKRVEL
ncbi:DNA polymerase III subunit chi [Stutzerimonas azotifigens]|uniref:DNA polymerase III subunit chi n=1 Tax=Stutzerimonas azotifigens TaxID=291995 RepID=UPI0004273653|nr:DNA polymerase III subunit chi [Stutzerimonas azotifigens]